MSYKKIRGFLRKCDCGTVAITEDDLELFEVDRASKYHRRNRCKKCAAIKTRGGTPVKAKVVTCTTCKTSYPEAEAYRFFRRTAPRGDMLAGNLSRVCKGCELGDVEGYVMIDGKLVPQDIKELQRNSRITSKPKEVI